VWTQFADEADMGAQADRESYFLTAEQQSAEHVASTLRGILRWAPLREAMDQAADGLLLLNEARQIIYTNAAFRHMLVPMEAEELIGKRIGDIFHCSRLIATPSGCGTGIACRGCHTANGLLTALRWGGSEFKGRLQVLDEGPREVPFRARVESVVVGNERLLFCALSLTHAHVFDPQILEQAPLDLYELCQLLSSGGPYCPY
jgi:hypothetical protein